METPASTRMITRSQSAAMLKKNKMQEEVEAKRQPLFDITNDSPIANLTIKETPTDRDASSIKDGASATDKQQTALSRGALLRCQVQTLLQKVEEEKDRGCVCVADKVLLSSSEKEDRLNQALVFDTTDKSEPTDIGSTDSSCLAFVDTREAEDTVSSSDDDCSSIWSLQVNDSSEKEDLDEEIEGETEESEEFELYRHHEEEDEEEEFLYDLCKGMTEMSIGEETESRKCANLPEYRGRHTKFVYNSEDEIEEQLIVLRGLPAPEGTHVRFSYEDDE